MELNLSTMFTKSSDTESPGGNSGWNLEAGQSRENNFVYNAKIGESDVLNGMVYNIIKDKENFSYGSPLGEKEILICSKFENVKVNIFDSWADGKEVQEEYDISLVDDINSEKYSAIVLAVAHDTFKTLDIPKLQKRKSVIYDIKNFLKIKDKSL